MKRITYLGLLLFCSIWQNVSAQDKIYKTNGEIIEVKVTEVGENELKYKFFSDLNGPNYIIKKNLISKVVYENGRLETYETLPKENLIVENKMAHNIFVELLGQGLTFTANYDTRFGKKRNGIGGRIGIGAVDGGDNSNIVTVPVSLNYLLGNGNKFFEIGLGATYLKGDFFDETESTIIGTMSFMYRLQPEKSGFSYRVGFTPIFNENFFIPYYFGLSLGYTF